MNDPEFLHLIKMLWPDLNVPDQLSGLVLNNEIEQVVTDLKQIV